MLEIGLGNPIQTPVQKPDFSELGRSIRQNLIKHIIVAVADKLMVTDYGFGCGASKKCISACLK